MASADLELHESPRRLLLIADTGFVHRLGAMVRHLVVGMLDSAVQVTMASPVDNGDVLFAPARFIKYEPHRLFGGRGPRPIIEAVQRHAPDVVIMFGQEHRIEREVQSAIDRPLVRVVSSTSDVESLATGPVPAAAVALSSRLEALVHRLGVLSPHRVKLIRPGVLVPKARPADATAEDVAEPPPPSPVEMRDTLLLRALEGQDAEVTVMLEAIQQLRKAHPELMVFALATGRAETHLRRESDRLRLRDQIIFAEEGTATIEPAGFDVLVLPAEQDALRYGVLRAMSAGVVILTPGAGNHDCLIDGETAVFYEPGSPTSAADRLAKLLKDRAYTRSVGEAGRAYVRANHAISGMVNAYAELQQELMPRR